MQPIVILVAIVITLVVEEVELLCLCTNLDGCLSCHKDYRFVFYCIVLCLLV